MATWGCVEGARKAKGDREVEYKRVYKRTGRRRVREERGEEGVNGLHRVPLKVVFCSPWNLRL